MGGISRRLLLYIRQYAPVLSQERTLFSSEYISPRSKRECAQPQRRSLQSSRWSVSLHFIDFNRVMSSPWCSMNSNSLSLKDGRITKESQSGCLTCQLGSPHVQLCLRCICLHWCSPNPGFQLRKVAGCAVHTSNRFIPKRGAEFKRVELLAGCKREEKPQSVFADPRKADLVRGKEGDGCLGASGRQGNSFVGEKGGDFECWCRKCSRSHTVLRR